MRKWRSILCILCLVLLAPVLLHARGLLPLDTQPLIEEKYGGWAGVLRLWIFEGWAPGSGSAAAWINRCIAAFEKRHGGVYVQPEYVDAAAIAEIGANGLLPPDMILFPPGVLSSPGGLVPLELPAERLRGTLVSSGGFGELTYAVPVAMGGYLWAYNASLLSGIPNTWENADAAMTAPPDEAFRQWGAALLALCSAKYSEAAPRDGGSASPIGELDLGLSLGGATPAPTESPAPDEGALDCVLPVGFDFSETAYRDFINGDIAAMPVTQREVRRLEALSSQGKGVEWQLALTGAGVFTDQLLYAGIVRDSADANPDAASKAELCLAFIDHLLGDSCQGELHRAGMFSVTDAASGYDSGDALLLMEHALSAPALSVPDAFDADWKAEAEAIVRKYVDGGAPASVLWGMLADGLRQKSEH